MRVILISGKARSGKNTVADMIRTMLGHHHVQNEAFARPLKEMCATAYKPLMDFLEKQYDHHDDDELVIRHDNWFERKTKLTRILLQVTGTEIVRTVKPSYWIDQTILNITGRFSRKNVKYVTVSDWRFPNEFDGVNEAFQNVFKVRIENPNVTSTDEHPSETALDNYTFDYTIKNGGNMEDLRLAVATMVDHIIEEDMP